MFEEEYVALAINRNHIYQAEHGHHLSEFELQKVIAKHQAEKKTRHSLLHLRHRK